MKRIDYSPSALKRFRELNCLEYTSDLCKYTGFWQKDRYFNQITSHGTTAFFEIGFEGSLLLFDADIRGDVLFSLDGKEVFPTYENLFAIYTENGRHHLSVKIYNDSHITIRKMYTDGQYFKIPDKRYVHFIGDSITNCQPGYTLSFAQMTGFDHSNVSKGGMSLCDGFGWYAMPEWMEKRMGMETRYFQLECLEDGDTKTPYEFTYCRIPDEIVVFLGTNDYLSTENDRLNKNDEKFIKTYIEFLTKLRSHYATSKIYVLKRVSGTNFCNECIEKVFAEVSKTDKNVILLPSDTWGIDISADGTHPSSLGYRQMAERLADIIK